MSNGSDIAAEVMAGLIEAGEATGNGRLYCVLRRTTGLGDDPWSGGTPTDTDTEFTAVQTQQKVRDANGTFIGKTMTVLLMEATGIAPLKSDTVALNIRKADVTSETRFHDIADIETTATGGVPLLYEVMLAD